MRFNDSIRKSPIKALLLAASAVSAAMLGGALVAQYGFGMHPCELCMAQRYPYMAVIAVGVLGAFLRLSGRARGYAAALCGGLFLLDAGIAGYHAGVEWGIFTGPTACSGSSLAGQSLEEMRRIIMNAALVPCNQPMAHFLGLSMAAWNGLIALGLGVATFALLYKGRKHA